MTVAIMNLATTAQLNEAYDKALAAFQEAAARETEAERRWRDLDKQLTELEDRRKPEKNPAKREKAIAALRLDVSDAWAAYSRLYKERRAAYAVLNDIMKAQGDL